MDTPSAYPDVMMMPMGLDASMQGFDMPKIPPEWTSVTTVMMRNIPNRYTQLMLLEEISSAGFAGTFDFLYLPIDPETSANKGYVFINFVNPIQAWRFRTAYEGQQMQCFNSNKYVSVCPATLQGLEANYAHYSSARCSRRDPATRPLFFSEPTSKFAPRNTNNQNNGHRGGHRRHGHGGGSLVDRAYLTKQQMQPQPQGPQATPPGAAGGAEAARKAPNPGRRFCPQCG